MRLKFGLEIRIILFRIWAVCLGLMLSEASNVRGDLECVYNSERRERRVFVTGNRWRALARCCAESLSARARGYLVFSAQNTCK